MVESQAAVPEPTPGPRFLKQEQVQEELGISASQVYALIRNKSLRAIKIGGRGQWRVARADLESFIERAYEETDRFLAENPFNPKGPAAVEEGDPS